MGSWSTVSVSVADLDQVLQLWAGEFGLEVRAQKQGSDPELTRLWGLEPGDISRQALLATPGAESGLVHFVQFTRPGPTVRDGAEVFDLCPKNLDIYLRDMPARIAELRARGHRFRNDDYSEVVAPDGTTFREIHMPAHDDVNIVLLEVIGKELSFTAQGYAGVGPLITIVGDAAAERLFYRDVLGLELLNDNILEGPEIERMVGLPPGAALDVSIWGTADEPLGQMEVIDYRGVEGKDLFPRAVPKRRGILQVSYRSPDLQELTRRLDRAALPWTDQGRATILPGAGRFIHFQSPAGLRIAAFQHD